MSGYTTHGSCWSQLHTPVCEFDETQRSHVTKHLFEYIRALQTNYAFELERHRLIKKIPAGMPSLLQESPTADTVVRIHDLLLDIDKTLPSIHETVPFHADNMTLPEGVAIILNDSLTLAARWYNYFVNVESYYSTRQTSYCRLFNSNGEVQVISEIQKALWYIARTFRETKSCQKVSAKLAAHSLKRAALLAMVSSLHVIYNGEQVLKYDYTRIMCMLNMPLFCRTSDVQLREVEKMLTCLMSAYMGVHSADETT